MNKKDLEQIREIVEEVLASKSKCTVIEKETEPKFEEGWYINPACKEFVGFWDGTNYVYGLTGSGIWFDVSTNICWSDSDKKADKKLVESMLIKEAKRRGFKKGVRYYCFLHRVERVCKTEKYSYDRGRNCLYVAGWIIFKDGKWATIIENKLEINGKEVRIELGEIIIGCKSGSLTALKSMLDELEYWGVDTIHHSETGDVKVKDLKDLL